MQARKSQFLVPGEHWTEISSVVERGNLAARLVRLVEAERTAGRERGGGRVEGIKILSGEAIVGADVVVNVGIELIVGKGGRRSGDKHVKSLRLGQDRVRRSGIGNQKLAVGQLELEEFDGRRIDG